MAEEVGLVEMERVRGRREALQGAVFRGSSPAIMLPQAPVATSVSAGAAPRAALSRLSAITSHSRAPQTWVGSLTAPAPAARIELAASRAASSTTRARYSAKPACVGAHEQPAMVPVMRGAVDVRIDDDRQALRERQPHRRHYIAEQRVALGGRPARNGPGSRGSRTKSRPT